MDNPAQYEDVVQKFGNPIRVFAESAILRMIGELTGDAETRFRELNRVCYPLGGDGVGALTDYASVTVAQVDWIRRQWQAEKARNPNLTPIEFARDNARDFFHPNVGVPDR
jgi:hypothetical protein